MGTLSTITETETSTIMDFPALYPPPPTPAIVPESSFAPGVKSAAGQYASVWRSYSHRYPPDGSSSTIPLASSSEILDLGYSRPEDEGIYFFPKQSAADQLHEPETTPAPSSFLLSVPGTTKYGVQSMPELDIGTPALEPMPAPFPLPSAARQGEVSSARNEDPNITLPSFSSGPARRSGKRYGEDVQRSFPGLLQRIKRKFQDWHEWGIAYEWEKGWEWGCFKRGRRRRREQAREMKRKREALGWGL
ncbi:uncharacterized protein RAG0_08378 [Rhynchosporium agropyri]|uniref:Uncharacterized protein n=1 Tax=Rhynchosporium agropyri TaxID=914238 RepID=A0A1E1KQK8_9HELO|nr:uncharacterized protein RAG0_08378 [Rhynchosporium agropyri]